jgi:hypothetical protein
VATIRSKRSLPIAGHNTGELRLPMCLCPVSCCVMKIQVFCYVSVLSDHRADDISFVAAVPQIDMSTVCWITTDW